MNKDTRTYALYISMLNLDGITFPMTFSQIPKFEQLNPNNSLTVLRYNMDDREPQKPWSEVNARDSAGDTAGDKTSTRKKSKTKSQHKLECFRFMQSRTSLLYNSNQQKSIHVDLMCLMS